ncbi:MAG: hypothetical protein K0S94_2238, partial [Nitrospira sp.]|nr:hypothetical protein [Nitrospira sp.]
VRFMIYQRSNGNAIDAIGTFHDLIIPEPFKGDQMYRCGASLPTP